jgi:hypothetical protein
VPAHSCSRRRTQRRAAEMRFVLPRDFIVSQTEKQPEFSGVALVFQ